MTTRTALIDDHPLLRQGIIRAFEQDSRFKVVGEANNGEECLNLVKSLQPELALLDLYMPGTPGLEILKRIRAKGLQICIVILTASERDDDVAACLRAGANGYLLKDIGPEQLLTQLRRAIAGDVVVSETLTSSLARALAGDHKLAAPDLNRLTAREREILRHLARGESNKAIARSLDITEGTTKVHVKNLLKKMSFRSRVEAAVWAVQNGLG